MSNDALIEVAAAAQHLAAKLAKIGIDLDQWKIQLTDYHAVDAIRSAATNVSGDFLTSGGAPLPPGVVARFGGMEIVGPPKPI